VTPKEKKESRKKWWAHQLQLFRLWLWCALAIGVTLVLPDLKNGIQGISLYVPNWLEVGVALGLAFILILIDEEMGGDKLIRSESVFRRKRKHAIITGFGVIGIIDKIFGN